MAKPNRWRLIRRRAGRPAAGVVFLWLLCSWLFASTLFTSKVLGSDSNLLFQVPFSPTPGLAPVNDWLFDALYVFHPDMEAARAALRSLRLPDWSPYLGAGEPLLATQQHAALYPVNWLALVLPFWQSLAWIAALKLLLAGSGMLMLLRSLRLHPAAAAFGGVSFGLCTFLVVWLEHPHVNTYALIPWALWSARGVVTTGRVGFAALFAIVVGSSLLGGHPESTFLLALITVPWCVLMLARHPSPLRRAGTLAAATALGVGLGAVMLIPFAEIVAHSYQLERGGGNGSSRNVLLSFFMPELWGRPDKFQIGGEPALPFPERTAYFGVLPLVLAVGGLAARRPRAEQVFFAATAIVAAGLVVHAPGYTELVRNLPVFRAVNLNRALVLCAFAGAGLGAFGLDALITGSRRTRMRLLAGATVVAAIPLVWALGHAYLFDRLGPALNQLPVQGHADVLARDVQMGAVLRWALIAALGLLGVGLAAWRPRFALPVALAVVMLTAVDLETMDHGYQPAIAAATVAPQRSPEIRQLERQIGSYRVAGDVELGPNVAERFGLRDARLHEQPILERRERLWIALGGQGVPQRPQLPAGDTRLADMFAVKFILQAPGPVSTGWRRVGDSALIERLQPRPRAWVAYGWREAVSMADALDVLSSGHARDDFQRPTIEGASPAPAAAGSAPARFVSDTSTGIALSVNATRRGYLILDDTYYPGWHAAVDGRPAKILPANVAFRAVAIGPGRHTVTFSYRPASVRIGFLVSMLSVVVLLSLVGLGWWHRGAR